MALYVHLYVLWKRIILIGPFFVKTSLIGPGVQQPMPRNRDCSNFKWHCLALCVSIRILLIGPFLVTTSLIGPGVQQSMPKGARAIQTYMALSSSVCLSKNSLDWPISCQTSLIGQGVQQSIPKGSRSIQTLHGISPALCVWLRILLIGPFFVITSLIGPGVQQPMQRERGFFQLDMTLSCTLCPKKEFFDWPISCQNVSDWSRRATTYAEGAWAARLAKVYAKRSTGYSNFTWHWSSSLPLCKKSFDWSIFC